MRGKLFKILYLVNVLLLSTACSVTIQTGDCNSIESIEKTGTDGNVDTYTITLTNGEKYTFTITNSEQGPQGEKGDTGASISDISFDEEGRMIITLSDGTVLDPIEFPKEEEHVHKFTEWDYLKEPTCENKGVMFRFCEECNYTESKYIDALGHKKVIDEAVESTPEKDGLTEGEHCEICGYVFVEQEIIPSSEFFSDLTFTAFGDSITYGSDLKIGGRVKNPYPTVVNEILEFKSYENKGVSGATLTANNVNRVCMTDRITSYTSQTDIIGVLGGVNDYYANLPLGDIDDYDTSTIYGALHVSMSYLSENYSDSFIFYMTPYKCFFSNRLWSDINSQGYNLEDVANAIKEVADIYEIPILDLFQYGDFESIMYDKDCDGVHPNQAFITNKMAPQIAEFIKTNYE